MIETMNVVRPQKSPFLEQYGPLRMRKIPISCRLLALPLTETPGVQVDSTSYLMIWLEAFMHVPRYFAIAISPRELHFCKGLSHLQMPEEELSESDRTRFLEN